ncbi:MAG: F0F1 ATP synthase subunit B [Bacilli bacterium]|nr:F0F1 ATP synthase subunit B [Bacilli bacterium]
MLASMLLPVMDDSPFSPSDFLGKLFPEGFGVNLLIQLLAFVVLLLAVIFLAVKPVKKLVKARRQYVEENLRGSEEAKKIAEKNAVESEGLITEAKEKAATIVEGAKIQAQKEADKIIEAAHEETVLMKKKADEDIETAKKKSEQETHDAIVEVAMEASSHVLGREVNSDDNARLVDDFVSDLEKGKK